MKMKLPVCIAFACLLSTSAISQTAYKEWDSKPALHKISTEYSNQSAVILEDSRVHEIKADEKNRLFISSYNKKLIRVNDDKGVELYNKIYVFVPDNSVLEEIKARSIQPDGRIIDLPQEKIFSVEEEGKQYKKFALEGLEKGSEIEYVVKIKKELSVFGIEVYQSNSTVENATFTLISPDYLDFTVKGYNGFKVGAVTLENKKRLITATSKDIIVIDEDKYATTVPHSQNVQYKLSYNHLKDSTVRLNTWNELANNVYNNYYTFNDKEQKAIESIYRQISIPSNATEELKIVTIEEYLKNNINTDQNAIGEDGDKLEKIVKNKVAGTFGFIRLFLGVLEMAGVKNQIVFSSKRNNYPIDTDFENYRLIDDPLIYFHATGNYLEPLNTSVRYPNVDPYSAGTLGLFLKNTSIGNFKTAIATFDTIQLQPYEKNSNNIYLKIMFNEALDSVILKSKQSMSGYTASAYRPIYSFLPKEKQDEITKDLIKNIAKGDNIKNIKVENSGMTDGSKNLNFNILGDITTASIIEKAGNKILVKMGEVIGSQVQMYQDKKRILPIVIQYPHALDREISFIIPTGYRIKNLDDINFNVTDKSATHPETMGFISSYSLKGAELLITIHEFYKATYYPVTHYDEFRKIINAASDFNKLTLILEKI